MKKLFSGLLIALLLSTALISCGNNTNTSTTDNPSDSSTEVIITSTRTINMDSITLESTKLLPEAVPNLNYTITTENASMLATSYYIGPVDSCITYRCPCGSINTYCGKYNIITHK